MLSRDSVPASDQTLHTLRSLLTRGRHLEAERWAKTHGRRLSREPGFRALRAEIALGLGRFAAALEWAAQALKDPHPSDAERRLTELLRVRALIGLGRLREAHRVLETRPAFQGPATACSLVLRGQVALRSGRLLEARVISDEACNLAQLARQRGALVEALVLRARIVREVGETGAARSDLDRAQRLCQGLRDVSALAGVLSEKADLMAYSGNWNEATRSAARSGCLYARTLSPHEHLSAGRRTGLLGLAKGDPNLALPSIERAADMARRGFGATDCRAEIDLLLADAQLAGRDPEGALERATAALSFFRDAQDPGGLARAHVRRSLASLSASNLALAYREARMALAIEGAGPVAQGLSDLALGRVMLRKDPSSARPSFERAGRNPSQYPPLKAVARLGLALAEGASPGGSRIREELSVIERFGDRRILAIVRTDLSELFGLEPHSSVPDEVITDRPQGPNLALEPEPAVEFLPGLVGSCPPVRRLSDRVRRAASTSLPVSIYGETGTGKENVARAVHHFSSRAARPFIPFNAASLSDELFESQLFGHVRGSFTGAQSDRPGLVEAAAGGTLFIDEIADLSLRAQVGLLRFLEQGTYRRVGENKERRADVRLVVAANQKLEELVAAGRFRNDLFHRINGFSLTVPPLRERGEDIVRLARHFIQQGERGRRFLSLESEAHLRAYSWPGNVRELRMEMLRAAALGDAPEIEWRKPEEPGIKEREITADDASGEVPSSLHEAVSGFERSHLKAILSRCGHRVEAARALGISRQALHQKMVRHGL